MGTMEPSGEEVQIINPIEALRRHPGMYIAKGVPLGIELARQLTEQLVMDEVAPISLQRSGQWWVISSAQDWLGDFQKRRVFEHPVADNGRYGPNGYIKEFLLAAFG